MRFSIQFDGIEKVRKHLEQLSGQQAREAFAKALNDTAYNARRAVQTEMASVFDRPTPYIVRSVQVRQATADKLTATVEPTYYGGKGVDPQQILRAQEFGGRRGDKRSEVALRRAGILPAGWQTAIPRQPFPGSDDGRGNIKGSFLVQLLTYLQAMGEQGYKANMSAKRKQALQRGTAKQVGRRYFVAYGRLRSGGTQHLAPGIWAAMGPGGVDVRPVLMFVKPGAYRPLLGMDRIAQQSGTGEYMARRLRYRIRQAAGV